MKLKNLICMCGAMSVLFISAISCSDKDSSGDSEWYDRFFYLGSYNATVDYNVQGVWNRYLTCTTGLKFDQLHINYCYNIEAGNYTGMLPSKVYDPVDHGTDYTSYPNWTGTITSEQDGMYFGNPFMLARWDISESLSEIPAAPSVAISFPMPFYPSYMTVSNSNAAYYLMKSRLAAADRISLVVTGVRSGVKTHSVEVSLSHDESGVPLNQFKRVELDRLEQVDYVYFQLKANNETGNEVIIDAPYFCMGVFAYSYGYNQ